MKDRTMKFMFCKKSLQTLLLEALIGHTAIAWAEIDKEKRNEHDFTYMQFAIGRALQYTSPIHVNLGAGVKLLGQSSYDDGNVLGFTLGRQFLREEDDKEKQLRIDALKRGEKYELPKPKRVELEFWNATVNRHTVKLATLTAHPNDQIKPRVLFVNAAIPIAESEEQYQPEDPNRKSEPLWRSWLGVGVGFANLSYPSASVISNCNCLRAASDTGLAFQIKLQVERQVDENTYLFGQIGRIWLPSVTTVEAAQRTEYGQLRFNNISIGVRWIFNP